MKQQTYLLFLLLSLLSFACAEPQREHEHTGQQAAAETTYTCPMHPQVVQQAPGTCPICHMDLVPVAQNIRGSGEKIEVADDLTFLLQPTNGSVISHISTVTPKQQAVPVAIEMDGIITYDERQIYTVPARVGGRIEQLMVRYNYQPVQKGQKLLALYSPELVTAQQEYIYLIRNAPEDQALIEAAKQKLQLLGATESQIKRLQKTREANYTFAIYSPYDGYVIGLNTTAPAATPGSTPVTSSSMGSSSMNTAAATTGSELQLREGMYVNPGQPLLRVVNPEQLWAEFNVPAGKVAAVAKGAPVQITFPQLPGEKLDARVDFLQPFFEDGENFAKLRAYLPGQQQLARVGQLILGKATYTTAPSLWVPEAAVLDLGNRHIVFKQLRGAFKPIPVTIGATQNGQVQVLSGLAATTAIAANAQFMVDGESFVKVDEHLL